jgi:outer membrane biosynthesis protein TonB
LTTEIDEIVERWTKIDSLPAALTRIAAKKEPQSSFVRWPVIGSGAAALLSVGLLIGAWYWLGERDKTPAADQAFSTINTAVKSPAAPEPPPVAVQAQVAPQGTSVPLNTPAPAKPELMPTVVASATPTLAQPPQPKPEPEPRPVVEQAPAAAPAPVVEQAPVAASSPSPQPVAEPRYVTVAGGQTLLKIAHANHVSAHDIAIANHLERPYELMIGDKLLIPDPATSKSPGA